MCPQAGQPSPGSLCVPSATLGVKLGWGYLIACLLTFCSFLEVKPGTVFSWGLPGYRWDQNLLTLFLTFRAPPTLVTIRIRKNLGQWVGGAGGP